jgi:hypothetical protein
MALDQDRHSDACGRTYDCQHDNDEGYLANFDADVEGEQRQRHVAARQPDIDQRAGEAETVQQMNNQLA